MPSVNPSPTSWSRIAARASSPLSDRLGRCRSASALGIAKMRAFKFVHLRRRRIIHCVTVVTPVTFEWRKGASCWFWCRFVPPRGWQSETRSASLSWRLGPKFTIVERGRTRSSGPAISRRKFSILSERRFPSCYDESPNSFGAKLAHCWNNRVYRRGESSAVYLRFASLHGKVASVSENARHLVQARTGTRLGSL